MVNPSGVGIRHAFDMGLPASEINFARGAHQVPGMSRALTGLWRVEFLQALIAIVFVALVIVIVRHLMARKRPDIAAHSSPWRFYFRVIIYGAILVFGIWQMISLSVYNNALEQSRIDPSVVVPTLSPMSQEVSQLLPIPAVTLLVIVGFCLFNTYFLRTKLGQDCRSVGQSQPIANAAGINVDRTRIIATIISTLLAAWGMIIYLQDMGTVSSYTAQRQIGLFSVASLLVGGATAAKASAKNAIFGLLLFHTMFIVSPGVGRLLPIPGENAENVAEYIRSFMMYAVIGVSLGLHVWKINKAAKNKMRLDPRVVARINADDAANADPLKLKTPD
jgi:simple sugar transport system permease protein